jgi:hypothetical protein
MELYLDAAGTVTGVKSRQGKRPDIQPSDKEVIGHLRPDAFASPDSPRSSECLYLGLYGE